jgi:hypothetical protein
VAGPPVELGPLAGLDGRQLLVADQRAADQGAVDDPNAALADGADGQLGLGGEAELADDDDVRGRAERPGDREGDRDSATGQAQDNRVRAAESLQPLRQPPAGVGPICESHRPPPRGDTLAADLSHPVGPMVPSTAA